MATGEGASFDDLLLAYLQEVTPTKRAPQRDQATARALYPYFTGRALAAIGPAEVRGYIATRQAKGMAPATINREVGLMVSAYKWARRQLDWEMDNPWEHRRLAVTNERTRWLTHDEARSLLRAANEPGNRCPWLGDFIRLCLATGLRPGEALGLEWRRVDLQRGLIRFEEGDQKNGKGGTVPINATARAALLARARWRAERCPASPWVFANWHGRRVSTVRYSFAAACTRAGIEDCHPHDLRRTCGSWLVQSGIGIERISKLLRHSSITITARVYAHLRQTDIEEAAAVLDRYELSRSLSRQGTTHQEEGNLTTGNDSRNPEKQQGAG